MRAAEHSQTAALSMRQRVSSGRLKRFGPRRCGEANGLFYSDYKDDGTNVLLDANENAYGPGLALNANANGALGAHPQIDFLGLNRYPDP